MASDDGSRGYIRPFAQSRRGAFFAVIAPLAIVVVAYNGRKTTFRHANLAHVHHAIGPVHFATGSMPEGGFPTGTLDSEERSVAAPGLLAAPGVAPAADLVRHVVELGPDVDFPLGDCTRGACGLSCAGLAGCVRF